jgi:hypothetical protein
MATTNPADALLEQRVSLLITYERACASGTQAGTPEQWRTLASQIADLAAKTSCRATVARLFDRADDCMARARRAESISAPRAAESAS